MIDSTWRERVPLAAKIRGLKLTIAQVVTDEFYRRHPEWEQRYGERGRPFCVEDEAYHLEFLAAALEGGVTTAFADYVRWARGVLTSRGMAAAFLEEALHLIGQALHLHLSEAERELLSPYLRAGLEAVRAPLAESSSATCHGSLSTTRTLFVQALLAGQRKAAHTIAMEAYRLGASIPDIYVDVLQESLYEIGRLWEANRITVAQEHMATAIVQYVLAQLYPLLQPVVPSVGNAVVTGVEGEMHQVGANMVADMLEVQGWNVRFLGTNMPHAGILQAIEEHRADAVGISATMLFNLPRVRRMVADIRDHFPARTPRIIVGGSAFRCNTNLSREVGADACGHDLRSVPELFSPKAS